MPCTVTVSHWANSLCAPAAVMRQYSSGTAVQLPEDALYPHYLCAMTDAALGETDRYVGEQAQYNSLLADLAAWLRRSYPTLTGAQWRW